MDKFTSRKFILAILSAIGGIAVSLTQLGGKVGVICAIVSAVIPAVTYIITEGVIDYKAVRLTANAIIDISDLLEGEGDKDENGN